MGRHGSWENHALSACRCVTTLLEADSRLLICWTAPRESEKHEDDAWFWLYNASISTHWAIRRVTTQNRKLAKTSTTSSNKPKLASFFELTLLLVERLKFINLRKRYFTSYLNRKPHSSPIPFHSIVGFEWALFVALLVAFSVGCFDPTFAISYPMTRCWFQKRPRCDARNHPIQYNILTWLGRPHTQSQSTKTDFS